MATFLTLHNSLICTASSPFQPSQLFQRFVIPIPLNRNYNTYNPFVPGGTRPRTWTKRNFSSFRSPA